MVDMLSLHVLVTPDASQGGDPRALRQGPGGPSSRAPWPASAAAMRPVGVARHRDGRIRRAATLGEGLRLGPPPRDGRKARPGGRYGPEWTVEDGGEAGAVLSCALGAGGWPLGGSVRQRIRLAPAGLVVAAEVEAER